jgi:ADP-heptose:LPS heptosyltransferase
LINCIYIIRYDGLGDALWAEPLIDYFAKKKRKVIVVTHYQQLFDNYPHRNVIIQYRLKKRQKIFQWIDKVFLGQKKFINLNGVYEQHPQQHILQAYFNHARLAIPLVKPKLFLSAKEIEDTPAKGKYVVLHLEGNSAKNYRNIYGVHWEKIAAWLNQLGYTVLQVGNSNKQIPNTEYFETSSVRALITLIHKASFFIGADSGPSHIAASLGTPSLIFFGSVNPWYRHLPHSFNGLILQQFCQFAGCYHEVIGTSGQTCKLVGDEGIPMCSLHTNEYVIEKIETLITKYLS